MRRELPKKLGNYKFALDIAGDISENGVVKNSSSNKAEYAISKIFELADRDLYIFADDMSCDNPRSKIYIRNIIKFLEKDISNKVNIILEKYNPNSESLNVLKILKTKKQFKNQISLRILKPETLVKKTKKGNKFHFTINPEKGIYRFEYDTIKRKALLNFNDENYSQKLRTLYDEYFLNSSELNSEQLAVNKTLGSLKDELDNNFLVA